MNILYWSLMLLLLFFFLYGLCGCVADKLLLEERKFNLRLTAVTFVMIMVLKIFWR